MLEARKMFAEHAKCGIINAGGIKRSDRLFVNFIVVIFFVPIAKETCGQVPDSTPFTK